MQRKRIEVSISAKSSWVLVCLSFFLCFQRLSCDDTTWIHLTSSHWWKSEVDESSNQGSCSLLLRILHSYCFPYWGFSWLAYNPGVDLKCFLKTALILSYIYITYKQVFPSRVCPWKSHMAKLPRRYGYGFSFVYTKAAWELVKFPDTEWSEDGEPWKRGVLTLDCPWRCMDDHRWRIWFWFLGEWLFNIGRPPLQVCYILLCCQRQVVYQWGLVLRTMCICQWPISICANIIQDTLLDATVTYRRFRWDRIKKPFVGFVGQQIFPRNPRTSWVDCSWGRLAEEMGAWMLCSTL